MENADEELKPGFDRCDLLISAQRRSMRTGERVGQAAMNILNSYEPLLHMAITGTNKDPSYISGQVVGHPNWARFCKVLEVWQEDSENG